MARKGRTGRITRTMTDPKEKEFLGNSIEGAKNNEGDINNKKGTGEGDKHHAE